MNKILYTLLVLLFSFGQAYSQEDASSMSDLLNQIQQGQARDSVEAQDREKRFHCLLYTSPSPRDATLSRMPSSA